LEPSSSGESQGSSADREVVGRVLAGDTGSFELIMRRHNQRLFRLARSIVKDDTEAEDVVQETYVRAFAALSTFEGRSQLGTWLGRIALNEALGRMRRREPNRDLALYDLVDGETMPIAPSPSPEQQASDEELRPLLEASIDALPTSFRTVFVLRAVEQLSVQETAELLEILPETVKTRFFRARGLLRKDLLARLDAVVPGSFAFLGERCDRIVDRVLSRIGPGESRS
jgi:RNA polymerase sigma-70 factor (ECF subfamily)